MATISFNTKKSDSPAVIEVQSDKAEVSLAVQEPKTLAIPRTNNNGIEGEITSDDLKVPRVNLVQKSGQLCDTFPPGSFLFDKQIMLAKPTLPFIATPLRFRKYYQEKIEFGTSNEMPARANTAEEVRALGGSLMYGHPRYFQDVADIMMAVQAPEGLDEEAMPFFSYSDGKENYGLAIYTVAASAYTSLGKRLLTDAQILLKTGLYQGQYEIFSELRKNASNSWYVPVGKFAGKHSEEKAEFFRNLASL
jgi:hypothetical protein